VFAAGAVPKWGRRRWSPAAVSFFPKAVRDTVLTGMLANQRVRANGATGRNPGLGTDELRLLFMSVQHVPVLASAVRP